ncbi:MAG: dUTP diphosphatase [Thermoanaerobaculia bacterium]|nr:dUTP diphosphatase [Thermoanaerobaculia bacterium]
MAARILIRRLPHARDLQLPSRASRSAAGYDLRAAIEEPLTLLPGQRATVPTGVALALPEGWEGQVRPRSGLARRHGLTVLNSPGTIDADYRGEVAVLLVHLGDERVTLERGERIAQLVPAQVADLDFEEVEELPATERGEGGFGSTGTT